LKRPEQDNVSVAGRSILRSAAGKYEDRSELADDVSAYGRSQSGRRRTKKKQDRTRSTVQGLPDGSGAEDESHNELSRPNLEFGELK